MNREDLRNLVLYWLDDLNAGYFTTTQVNLWLNNAQKEVQKLILQSGQNRYLKCVSTSLVVNQGDYVLPSDFLKLNRLSIITSGSYPNESFYDVNPITLNQTTLVPNQTGSPQYYYLKKNRIFLTPSPDTAYTLKMYYTYLIPDLSSDSETPDIPTEYQEFISLLAAEDGFIKDDRENSKLIKKINDYRMMLKQDAQERKLDAPRDIVVTGWDDEEVYYW